MKKSKYYIRGIALASAFALGLQVPLSTQAVTQKEIQDDIKRRQDELSQIQNQIGNLEDQQDLLEELIADLNSEIINTMTSIGLKEDEITEKEDQIVQKQQEIDITQVQYEEAKETEQKQQDDMITRAQRMYETESGNYLSAFLVGGGLGKVLNRMDYIEEVYEYDRKKLLEYEECKKQVHALWDQLEEEKVQLNEDKVQLEADREALKNQKSNLDVMLAKKKAESANFETEIRQARQEASVQKKLIQQDKAKLEKLKKQQEEEKKKKQEQDKQKENGNSTGNGTGNGTGDGTGNGTGNSTDNGTGNSTDNGTGAVTDNPTGSGNSSGIDSGNETGGGTGTDNGTGTDGNNMDPSIDGGGDTTPETPPDTPSGSSSYDSIIDGARGSDLGKKIAKYACKWIGNPYVPGGTSLTSGADCSGFTYRVYADFGYTLPRTSYEQRSAGTAVDYANAQPGDLICYDGHVAMYIGGGLIVHASTQRSGIKVSNANYRSMLGVRRIVN